MNANKQMEFVQLLPVDKKDDWVIERRSIDVKVEELGENVRPTALACVSVKDGLIIGFTMVSDDTPESEVLAWVLDCLQSPMAGEPRRPASITLIGGELKHLQTKLEQLDIHVSTRSLPHPLVDEFISSLEEDFNEPAMPPYTYRQDVDPQVVADFFTATAEYYKLKPWKLFDYEIPIKVEIKQKKKATYWAIVMGVEGKEFGLSLYKSFGDLMMLMDSGPNTDILDVGKSLWTCAFTYDNFNDIGSLAQAECLFHEFILANNSAYPSALVINPKSKQLVDRPSQNELIDLTAVTLALVEFFKEHKKQVKNEDVIDDDIRQIEVFGKKISAKINFPAPELDEYEYEDDEDEDEDEIIPFTQFKMSPELARAQDMIFMAMDESSKSKRIKLVKQALIISPDCVDGYLILAEDAARDAREKAKFLQDAVDAGARIIGEENFEALEGIFWLALQTMPYMKARVELADFKYRQGEYEEAAKDYQDMLRLDANDSLGNRYALFSCLLLIGRDDELSTLLKTYKNDPSAFVMYTKALYNFRKYGKSKRASQSLTKAINENEHVVAYLLEHKRLPGYTPDDYILGSEEEAILYTELFLQPWKSTEGATEWLQEIADTEL